MLLHWLYLCFLQAVLLPFCSETANGEVRQEVSVPAVWKKSVYENHNVEKVTEKITFTKGIRNRRGDTRTLTATSDIGGVVAVEDVFKIAKLELTYSFSNTASRDTMTENEIYETRSIEHTVTIPPKSTLTRWRLDVDVAGIHIDYSHYIDVVNNTYTSPRTYLSLATLLLRRRIQYGITNLRIKHLEREEYMIVVKRKSWPAATLGYSNRFHFILHKYSLGIRIETLNTMYSGYQWAYSAETGGIYFDLDRGSDINNHNPKQFWLISKDEPIYDGDIVTFRNKYFDDSTLCYYDGPATNVYCLQNHQDKWVLEVVQ